MRSSLALPIVRRCVCGHVLDWHWRVGQTGGVVLDPVNGPRCPDWTCECSQPQHDGRDPEQLPNVGGFPSLWPDQEEGR